MTALPRACPTLRIIRCWYSMFDSAAETLLRDKVIKHLFFGEFIGIGSGKNYQAIIVLIKDRSFAGLKMTMAFKIFLYS